MTLGLSSRTGPFGGPYMGRKPPLVQFTAHSSESFSVQGRDGGMGESPTKNFWKFLCVRSTGLEQGRDVEGCSFLGGRVDLAGILRSDDCCRPSTGEVLMGRQGHASWSVEPREAFEGPQGQGRSRRELLWRAEDIRGFTARSKG